MRRYIGRYAVSITKYNTVLEVSMVDQLGRTIKSRVANTQGDADRIFFLFCRDASNM